MTASKNGPPPGYKEVRLSKWYFGGLASAGAACFTHPLDLIKVHYQTESKGSTGKPSILRTSKRVFATDGVRGFYSGLSASLLRQLTYSTTRFGFYEVGKQQISPDGSPISLLQSIVLAGGAGAAGGLVGSPADMVNVRMQNDIKLPADQRRNYKNAIDGLLKIYKFEGTKALFNGATMATARAIMMSIGQLAMYDQFKMLLLVYMSAVFEDNVTTHLTASTLTGAVATCMTQPLDVLKTRMMNAETKRSVLSSVSGLYKEAGVMGFFKGYIPAFVRLAPHTILTFVFMEQLRMNFGTKIHKKIQQ